MALAEKFLDAHPSTFGLPCGIAKISEKMTSDDYETLVRVMDAPVSDPHRVSNRKIHEILISEGYDVSFSSISLHRRRVCRCFTGKNASDSAKKR